MCTQSCLEFIGKYLHDAEVRDLSILEVGALDVNGSVRPLLTRFDPKHYLGVDMQEGTGVDDVCSAEDLVVRFGENAFDVVVSTEMLEHVFDWRCVLHNLKRVLKPNGLLLITTRSIGFKYHAYPYDFWRYQLDDMRVLFADYDIIELIDDPLSPGVFLKARKPQNFTETNLDTHALFSMITSRRTVAVSARRIALFHWLRRVTQPLRTVERTVRRARNRILRREARHKA